MESILLLRKNDFEFLMKEFCINLLIYRYIWYNFQGKSRRKSCNVMLHVPKQFSWYETKPRSVSLNKLQKKSFEVSTYLLIFQIGHKTSNIDSIMNKNDLTDILDILHGETVFSTRQRSIFTELPPRVTKKRQRKY